MATLYVFALVRSGAWELELNKAAPVQLVNGKPLPGNKLTAHTLGLVKWNTQLDKALLGARIFASTQKGWDEVLSFARVLDDALKPAATPDEELQRNEQLVTILAKLKVEVPEVESGIAALAAKLGGTVPKPFTELCARLKALANYAPLYALYSLRFPSRVQKGSHDLFQHGQLTNRSDSFEDHRNTARYLLEEHLNPVAAFLVSCVTAQRAICESLGLMEHA